MHFIKDANYIGDYTVEITFEGGEKKKTNLEKYVGKGFVFGPLKNKDFFKTFTVANDTLTWETGADFSPDFLYEIGK